MNCNSCNYKWDKEACRNCKAEECPKCGANLFKWRLTFGEEHRCIVGKVVFQGKAKDMILEKISKSYIRFTEPFEPVDFSRN